MTTLLIALAVIGALAVGASAVMIFFIIWVGRGEPDVNGDPERDADMSQSLMGLPWDAEIMCSLCGRHLDGTRLPPSGSTFFRLCDKCRDDAEAEIHDVAEAVITATK